MEELTNDLESLTVQVVQFTQQNDHDNNSSSNNNGTMLPAEGRRQLRSLQQQLQALHALLVEGCSETDIGGSTTVVPDSSLSWRLQRILWNLLCRLVVPSVTNDGKELCFNSLILASQCWMFLVSLGDSTVKQQHLKQPNPSQCFDITVLQWRLAQEYPSMVEEEDLDQRQNAHLWLVQVVNCGYAHDFASTAKTSRSIHIALVLLQRVLPDCIRSSFESEMTAKATAPSMVLGPCVTRDAYHLLVGYLLEQIVQASLLRPHEWTLEKWLHSQFSSQQEHYEDKEDEEDSQQLMVGALALQIMEYTTALVERAQDALDAANLALLQHQHSPDQGQLVVEEEQENHEEQEALKGDCSKTTRNCSNMEQGIHWTVLAVNALEPLQHWYWQQGTGAWGGVVPQPQPLLLQLWRTLCLSIIFEGDNDQFCVAKILWRLTHLVWKPQQCINNNLQPHSETESLAMATLRLLPYASVLTVEQGPNALWNVLCQAILPRRGHNGNSNCDKRENMTADFVIQEHHSIQQQQQSDTARMLPLLPCDHAPATNPGALELKRVLQVALCHVAQNSSCRNDPHMAPIVQQLLPCAMAYMNEDVFDHLFQIEWKRILARSFSTNSQEG